MFQALWRKDIEFMSRKYKHYFRDAAHGLESEADDVQQELALVLYKAWCLWKPARGKFGVYFWSMVRNKLTDQVRKLNADMRQVEVSGWPENFDPEESSDHYSVTVALMLPITGIHDKEVEVWLAIAYGHLTASQLRAQYGHRTYSHLINAWKSAISGFREEMLS